jgi:hypothetical protein
MKKDVVLVLGGLALGAIAGAALVPRVLAQTAPPPAPHGPPAPRWQQFCEPVSSIPEGSGIAGARGAEGWELVTFAGGAMCFKRLAQPKGPGDVGWPGY